MSAEPDGGVQPVLEGRRRRLLRPIARGLRELVKRPLAATAVVGIVAFVASAAILAWGRHDRPVLRFAVAFSQNDCCSWQVWVNGTTLRDVTVLPMQWGREATYSVPLFTSRVVHLRMPLGQTPGGTITLRRIWITRGSTTVSEVDPSTLSVTPYFATKRAVPNGVAFTATSSAPFLDVPVVLDTRESSFRLFVARVASEPLTTLVGLLLAGVVLTAAFALSSRQRLMLVSLAVTALVVRGLPWLSWRLPLRDSVAQSVGFASYQGLWKTREEFVLDAAALAALLIPIVIVVGARVLQRRRNADAPEPAVEAPAADVPARPLPRKIAAAMIAAPVALIALASLPNLRLLIGGPPQYEPSWDANNLIFWHYLIAAKHLEPMTDFWWPYGFQWLFDKPVPWGDLMSYGIYVTLWSFLAVGSYFTLARFFSGRALVIRYLLLAAFWVSVSFAGFAPLVTRYVAPLGVVLLFTAIPAAERFASWRRLAFAAALAEVALFELAQAAYALVPIAFVLAAGFVFAYGAGRRVAALELLRGIASVAAGLLLATLGYVFTGELGGTASYYRQFSALRVTYSLPGQLDAWVTHPTGLDGFLFWSVPIALTLAAYGVIARRDRARPLYVVMVALGILGLMIMQKQTIRPSISPQIWFPVAFPLAFWAVAEVRLPPLRRWIGIAACAGAIAAVVLVSGGYRAGWDAVRGAPHRLSQSVGALVHDRSAFAATAGKTYVPAAFDKFTTYKPVVAALRKIPAVRNGGPVWILGDDSPITMMLGHSWPYYFSDLYDTSPIAFQKDVIRRLGRTPPVRVVWNFAPPAMIFDTVPNVVRVPLLYDWAVTHLVPESTVGTFAILRSRHGDEPVALAWWRRRIGLAVDLGHIPVVAQLPQRACAAGHPCGSYLVESVPEGRPIPAAFDVPIRVAGLSFDVKFTAAPGDRRYIVPLDRLWFWSAAPRSARRIVRTGDAGGAVTTVVRRQRDLGTLY
jgi:hypothetical protein